MKQSQFDNIVKRPLSKTVSLPKKVYYETHLHLINPLLPEVLPEGEVMTPGEIRILAWFMSLEGDITKDRFSSAARKMIRKELEISHGGLGNFMRTLKAKKLILEDGEGVLSINPLVMVGSMEQSYYFKLIKANEV